LVEVKLFWFKKILIEAEAEKSLEVFGGAKMCDGACFA
jgi:hypothetical protein